MTYRDVPHARVDPHWCPFCNYEMDCVTGVTGAPLPKEGDLAMCIKCGEFSIFTKDVQMRKPTPDEKKELDSNPTVMKARKHWRQVMSKNN